MIDSRLKEIFKNGSKTYYNSSYFFPKNIRQQIFVLYAFVRTVDDLVDAIPSQKKEFYEFKEDWQNGIKSGKSENFIIQAFLDLGEQLQFENVWTEAFFDSMNMDLEAKKYATLADTEKYIYGSAEVIGLYIAKILKLPAESYTGAMQLGKAMQYINFIRDVAEDNLLNRSYFPAEDFKILGLSSLKPEYVFSSEEAKSEFDKFIKIQLSRYFVWQKDAENSFQYIPKRYLIPIKTASEMYKWTARKIEEDSLQIFTKKIKPRRYNIFLTAIKEAIKLTV